MKIKKTTMKIYFGIPYLLFLLTTQFPHILYIEDFLSILVRRRRVARHDESV